MELNDENFNLEIIKLDNMKYFKFLFMFDKKITVSKKNIFI